VIDLLRKRKDRVISLDSEQISHTNLSLSALISDLRYNAENRLDKKQMRRRLYEAIDNLNDEDRAVVIETELEKRTFKELSHQWGIPMGTLLARKHRALRKIRKLLED
jgi:RNA polymerase sigma-70 factor (ECF subfamily)